MRGNDCGRSRAITRRSLLKAALPLAAVPLLGTLTRAQDAFRFLVVNDVHHNSDACTPFFEALVAQMRRHAPVDLCLIVGDIADQGRPESLVAVRDTFAKLEVPVYTVPGNHDCDVEQTTRIYSEVFPDRMSYTFRHRGWQFVGLDSTEGNNWQKTRVGAETLAWLDRTIPTLDAGAPTVVFTHFPMAADVMLVPVNASDVLTRIAPLDVKAVFTGHFHARIERQQDDIPLVTNACCSRMRDNHDGSLEEGYLLCSAYPDGRLAWEFVEFAAARKQESASGRPAAVGSVAARDF